MDGFTEWSALNTSLQTIVENETTAVVAEAFANVDDTLFNLSQNDSRSSHMMALRLLRTKRTDLLQKWRSSVREGFASWTPKQTTVEIDDLTLLSNDDLEKQLAAQQFAEMIKKTHPIFVRKLETLIASFKTNNEDCPIHPLGLANLIKNLMNDIDLPVDSHLVVLKILERDFTKSLSTLYPKVFDALRSSGVNDRDLSNNFIPVQNTDALHEKPASFLPSPDETSDSQLMGNFWSDQVDSVASHSKPAPQTQTYQSIHQQGVKVPVYGQQSPQHTWTPELQQNLTRMLTELLSDPSQNSTENSLYGSGMDSGYYAVSNTIGVTHPTSANTIPLSEMDPAVSELISALQARRSTRRPPQSTKLQVPPMSNSAVRSVLDSLQKDLPQSVKEVARDNSQELTKQFKLEMLDKALQMGVRSPESALTDKDEDAIDIVGMLFEIFLSEREIVSEMREKIAKLLAPYIKVALNDRKMFMHKAHPARRFLDVLAQACEGNSGISSSEKNTLNKVSTSIEELVTHFNEDLAIFEMAESEIQSFIAHQKTVSENAEKRSAEAQKGAERLERAKQQSQTFFDEHTYMMPWATTFLDSLKVYWTQHHTITLLRNEDDPIAVRKSETILTDLLSVVNKGSNLSDVSQLDSHLRTVLSSSGLVDMAAGNTSMAILEALRNAYQLKPSQVPHVSPPVTKQIADPITSSFDTELVNSGISFSEESHKVLVDYFRNIPIGTWVDFVRSDGTVVNTKLSWVSPISSRLLFVTARGTRHAVERPEDMAKMVVLERVRLRDFGVGENGFDYSFRKAIDLFKTSQENALNSNKENNFSSEKLSSIPFSLSKRSLN